MHLAHLSLTNFRIFSRLELEFPRRVILFHGSNAQGKTSILEAVAFLAIFTSFSSSSDRQMINFNLPESDPLQVARIVAEYQRNNKKQNLEARLILEKNGGEGLFRLRKEALLNGVSRRFSDLYGQFNAVSFLPQMSKIIEGSPSDRRRYLDEVLCQVEPGYSRHLIRYNQANTRRNALLKHLAEQNGNPNQLEPWDVMLSEHGAILIRGRIKLISQLEALARQSHHDLTGGKEVFRIDYQPSFDPLTEENGQLGLPVDQIADRGNIDLSEIQKGFQSGLERRHRQDILRGSTGIGPHRDEMRLLANQVDLGNYGSRGQSRTALLSLKFAEVELMHARTGEWPVLLLDEVMAELDPLRRQALMQLLDKVEQAFVTTTDLDMFDPDFLRNHEIWKVHQGVVTGA